MSFWLSFYPGDRVMALLAVVAATVTAVLLVALLLAALVRRHAAIRSAILLLGLAFVLASPFMVIAFDAAGLTWLRLPIQKESMATAEDSPASSDLTVAKNSPPVLVGFVASGVLVQRFLCNHVYTETRAFRSTVVQRKTRWTTTPTSILPATDSDRFIAASSHNEHNLRTLTQPLVRLVHRQPRNGVRW